MEVTENKGTVSRHSLPIDHPPAQCIIQGGKDNSSWLLPGERESWNIYPAFHPFCGLPEDWYLSPASEHWWDMIYSRSLDASGLLNNTRELGSTLLLQSTCKTADRERGWYSSTPLPQGKERGACAPRVLLRTEKGEKKKTVKQEYYIQQNCASQRENKQSWGNSSSMGLSYKKCNVIFIYLFKVNLYLYTVKRKSHRKKIIFMTTLFIKFEEKIKSS